MTRLERRVFPHVLAAALATGLVLANGVRAHGAVVAVAAGGLALAAVWLRPDLRVAGLCVALLAGGWWWGSVRLETLDASVLTAEVGESARTLAVVTGPARRGTYSLRVPATVVRFGSLEPDEDVLLRLPLGRAPPQGAVVELTARVESPRPAHGGFDERTWLRRRGIQVVVDGAAWRQVGRRGGLAGAGDRLRAHIARSLAPGIARERRAVLAGIVLGEDEGLSRELQDSFRASGLYHLLAVSGQNVAFIAGGALLVVWLVGAPRWVGHTAALAAIGGYVLAVGWQPPVVRAGVAGVLASLAWLLARPADRWYFLLLGAIVLLAWNPYSVLDPGFQLSFAAVAAIFVAVPRLEHRLEGYPLPRRLAEIVAISGGCGAATAPLLWLHFGAVPVFSILANALAAPVVAPLLGLGLFAAALAPLAPGGAALVGWANGWLAAYLAGCARLVASLPHAQLDSGAELAVACGLAGGSILIVRSRARRRRTAAAALAAVALVAGAWRIWTPRTALPPPQGVRVTFLDVGQGDSTLIQTRAGAVLVDEGPPEADVASQLRSLGVRELQLLVLTHPSRDNIGGAVDVLRRIPVELVLEPDLPFPNPFGRPALAEARRRGVRVAVARAGQRYRLGRLRLEVLWPDGRASPADDPNDHATVLLASYGEFDALLPADAESNVLLRLRLPPVELLKVSHHGSADDGLPQLLGRTRPRVAVISVGARNDYGHPRASTLGALDEAPGLSVYRTDRDGRVAVDSDGSRFRVREQR